MSESQISKVVDGGYCIGCGACVAYLEKQSTPSVLINDDGFYRLDSVISRADDERACQVCPFSNSSPNEDTLGVEVHTLDTKFNSSIGRYRGLFAGHVEEAGFRQRGSSGGLTSWLLAQLFKSDLVDAVIHVGKSGKTDLLYEYRISRSIDEIIQNSKSQYYPVEMSRVLDEVRSTPGRYAIVGVPCYIKAMRLLMRQDEILRERIEYCVGLFCGHLKSKAFAEYLGLQMGISPGELADFDFRTKLSDRPASKYAVSATSSSGKVVSRPTHSLKGTDWGMGFFKYKACDFCDDISAELADISIGDAWLPEYESDFKGTNLVITRNESLAELLERGQESGHIHLEPITVEKALQSQKGNVRHRQEEISYRLHLEDVAGRWRPKKRRKPDADFDTRRAEIQEARIRIRDRLPLLWNEAKQRGRYGKFHRAVRREVTLYNKLYGRYSSLSQKIIGKVKIHFRRLRSVK